jgi:hypothetical protein
VNAVFPFDLNNPKSDRFSLERYRKETYKKNAGNCLYTWSATVDVFVS